eukprot:6480623-Amphidinium_carterae.3
MAWIRTCFTRYETDVNAYEDLRLHRCEELQARLRSDAAVASGRHQIDDIVDRPSEVSWTCETKRQAKEPHKRPSFDARRVQEHQVLAQVLVDHHHALDENTPMHVCETTNNAPNPPFPRHSTSRRRAASVRCTEFALQACGRKSRPGRDPKPVTLMMCTHDTFIFSVSK